MAALTVPFRHKFPWALLPMHERIDADAAKEHAAAAQAHFRWHRAGRTPELCWPWRLAAELGWIIRAPVDVRVEPFHDFDVAAPDGHGPALEELLSDYDLWRHDQTTLAVAKRESRWMKLYDFHSEHGWQSMFVPNGRGTVEWHLGWACDWPEGYFALLLPHSPDAPVQVVPGVLDAKHLAAASARLGVSIAVKPTRIAEIRRGDPIARLVLLHADSLRAR